MNIEMQEFAERESPAPQKRAPVVVVVMAATVIGATSGIFIADRDSGLARVLVSRTPNAQVAHAKPEMPAPQNPKTTTSRGDGPAEAIPIKLPSLDAIRYSVQAGSVHMDFDLGSAKLVGTGVLDGPDRIYIDLKEGPDEQGEAWRLKTQKTVGVDCGPVTRVRLARREAGAMRIVLDLSRSCDFTYQVMPVSPPRLSLEIRPRVTGVSDHRSPG